MRAGAADAPIGRRIAEARLPDRWLEGMLVFVIAASIAGVGLALAGRFSASAVLTVATLAGGGWAWRSRAAPAALPGLRAWQVAPILLLALWLRLPTALVVQGGQDPGVYTNVAAQIARTGGIGVQDPVFARLQGSSALAQYRADNYTDPFLPGVYTLGESEPRLVFQFYHLLPAWMAVCIDLFGLPAAGYAVVMFALLSVLFFQRLALQLTGSAAAAATAGLLLATNPLHALFSSWPLTEVPTLAFSSAGFCLLAMHAAAPAGQRPRRWLVLSVLAFACLFLTRISGFMYLPIVLATAFTSGLVDADRERARDLQRWALGVLVAYAVSLAYGLTWSEPYSRRIYSDAFLPLFGKQWRTWLAVGALVVAVGWVATLRAPGGRLAARLRQAVPVLDRLIGWSPWALLAWALWKGWRLAFAPSAAMVAALQPFPGVAGAGWASFAHLSVTAAAMYLGPASLLALLVLAPGRWPPAGRLLVVLVACFFGYAAVLNWVLPYQPYYGRYLLSELLPYGLLLVCCALAWLPRGPARAAVAAALGLSLAGNAVLLVRQAGAPEDSGAYGSLAALAERIGANDVLLLDSYRRGGFEHKATKSPLTFVFGRHVVTVGHGGFSDVGYLRTLDARFDRVLLATTDPVEPAGFHRIGRHPLRAVGFAHSPWPAGPRTATLDVVLHLYAMDSAAWTVGRRSSFNPPATEARSAVGLPRRYPPGLVAHGVPGVLLSTFEYGLPAGRYRLLLRGWDDGRVDARVSLVDAGGAVLAQAPLAARRSPSGLLAAPVLDLPQPEERIEVRVEVDRGSTVAIRSYTLTRLR